MSAVSKYVSPFVVFDFETGGLDCQKHAVTEIAMIAITGDTLQEIARFDSYLQYNYNPAFEYGQQALDITGISIEDLEGGLPLNDFVNGIIDVLVKANATAGSKFQKAILVGHNPEFDIGFLQQLFKLTKNDLSKYVAGQKDYHGNFIPSTIDTMKLAKMKFQDDPTVENFKLVSVVNKTGLELNDAHRAINDVIATKELFVEDISRIRTTSDNTSGKSKNRHRNHFQF